MRPHTLEYALEPAEVEHAVNNPKPAPTTIDEYIARFPEAMQPRLQEMRAIIRAAAPQATERISYGMAGFFQDGPLVYFGGFKAHTGFYPIPSGLAAFEEALSAFRTSKGGVQFPHDAPLPHDLIRRIVAFRLAENADKAARKREKRK